MKENLKELYLTDEFMEHFTGFMLGDGSLSNRNKCRTSSQFFLRNKHQSYIYYVSKLLTKEKIDHTVKINEYKGNFAGSKKTSGIYTKFYTTFLELEKKWYETRSDGTHFKIVPSELKITPNVLLQWYIGDGYLVNLRGNPVRVQFCTERYTDDEILFLRDCFKRDLGLDIQIDFNRRRLRIPTRHLNEFFEILPACPDEIKNDLGYKWAYKRTG